MPEVKNKPPDEVVVNVAEHLNPNPFGKVVKKARTHVDDPGVGGVKVACDLHRLVRMKVDYSEYANFRFSPLECIESEGNCVDTTCLFCSLMIRAGFQCRIVSVSEENRGHMFSEILVKGSHENIHADIVDYYGSRRWLGKLDTVSVEADKSDHRWVIADPATSNFLGDITGLRKLGYIKESAKATPGLTGDVDRYKIDFG